MLSAPGPAATHERVHGVSEAKDVVYKLEIGLPK